jgi:tellurite resistance protein TehA-like permease
MVPLAALREGVRTLYPGYFALVMATGIVSIALSDLAPAVVSAVLMWVAAAAYALLLAMLAWRAVAFRADLARDLRDPVRAFGIFTLVAATNVLGTRLTMAGHVTAAEVLLLAGAAAWLLLGYGIPWATLTTVHRPVVQAANGTWFIWVVATQSVAVLAASLEPDLAGVRRELALLAVSCWAIGTFLYVVVGGLVAARLLLYDVAPEDLTAPYWVSMGAAAITVVSGVRITRMAAAPALLPTGGLIGGISVLFWAFASWLIPLLLAVGWRRHVTHRIPLRYEPALWSIVFPLGMYAVASRTLGATLHLPIVSTIGTVQVWVAAAVWVVVGAATATHLVGSTRKRAFSRLSP